MKRTPPKTLKLKRDTLRQLARIELTRAGGANAHAVETELVTCPWTQTPIDKAGG